MRLLDALHQTAPRRKHTGTTMFVLGACAVLGFGAAIPLYGAGPQQGGASALTEFQTNGGMRDGSSLTLVEGSLARLKFSKAISAEELGVKMANGDVAQVDSARANELLVTAKKVGRTNLIVWFKEGEPETYSIVVKRDLSMLEGALKGIHGSIEVQSAADRNALVLTGSVPDGLSAKRAEDAARAFAESIGSDSTAGRVINLIRVQSVASAMESTLTTQIAKLGAPGITVSRIQRGPLADDANDVFVVSGTVADLRTLDDVLDLVRASVGDSRGQSSRVVNQIVISDQPSSIDSVLERAIHDQLGHKKVKVARVSGMDTQGDGDILVLTGSVASQTGLVQTLSLAAKVFQQQTLLSRRRNGEIERLVESLPGGGLRTTEKPLRLENGADDVRVLADESGALVGRRDSAGQDGSALRSILSTPNGGLGGGGSAGLGQILENRIGTNIARAKAIELAEGRILSFIQVTDIPQVRVSIRIFELSRNDLLNWDSNINKLGAADFDTNGINPNTPLFGADDTIVNNANGDPILFASNTDISNVVSFLEGGFANQIQIGGEHFNLDAVFRLLETESVARTLANPTLTVLSGEIAAFSDGGSVSVTNSVSTSVGGVNGGNAGVFESVQQLPFGIQLAVRPLVDEDGYITLDVAPSVSNPDFALTTLVRQTTGQPQETVAFAEKNLRTSARVRDGEVLLIGGLQDRSRTDEAGKTPFLADIPILGWLFQDKSFEDKDRETMISVSPTIVRDRPTQARLWSYPTASELLLRVPKSGEQAMPPQDKPEPKPKTAPAGK